MLDGRKGVRFVPPRTVLVIRQDWMVCISDHFVVVVNRFLVAVLQVATVCVAAFVEEISQDAAFCLVCLDHVVCCPLVGVLVGVGCELSLSFLTLSLLVLNLESLQLGWGGGCPPEEAPL